MKREDRKARSIAANLQRVIEPGDCMLLILPASLDYALAFVGCVYAGAIAVPAITAPVARSPNLGP
jgi:acyl-CoA synthetase (AMP-forming)/AMP-acid ligase II